jgi:ABC-type transporter Mla subunit MlaD
MTAPQSTPTAGRFAAQVADERKLLFDLTGAGPLQQVEADNEKAFDDLLQSLVANAGARFVAQELDKRHQNYRKTFDPRLKQITDRLAAIRRAVRKARRSLKQAAAKAPPLASVLTTQRSELDKAQRELRGAGKGVARHLSAILRRGKLERVGLDALHAVLFLAVFTFGFEWLGNRSAGGRLTGSGSKHCPEEIAQLCGSSSP